MKKTFLVFVLASAILYSGVLLAADKVVVVPLIKNHVSAIPPSEVVNLTVYALNDSLEKNVFRETPEGGAAPGNYSVPTGKYLVITSMVVTPRSPSTPGNLFLQLIQNSNSRKYWVLPNSQPTQLNFSPGMLIAPEYSLKINNFSSSAGDIAVDFYGYHVQEN